LVRLSGLDAVRLLRAGERLLRAGERWLRRRGDAVSSCDVNQL